MEERILEVFHARKKDMLFSDAIAAIIMNEDGAGADRGDSFTDEVAAAVKHLVASGRLLMSKSGRVGLPEAFGFVLGIILINDKGYGFFRPVGGGSDRKMDVFVRKSEMKGALHRDTVLVRIKHTSRGAEAEIDRIVKRATDVFVGAFEGSEIVPNDRKVYRSLVVAENGVGAKPGDVVMAKVVSWNNDARPIRCRIVEVLGRLGDKGLDILTIAKQFGLEAEFPQEVLDEAETLPREMHLGRRADFRHLETVTIDGADAKDIDDAISLEILPEGCRLYVHIADVSHYVRPGTALDEEAQRRGTSAYLLDRVIPMLPTRLSNDLCSLNAGEDRYALSCVIDYGADGEMRAHDIVKSLIRVDSRLEYEGVSALLEPKSAASGANEASNANEASDANEASNANEGSDADEASGANEGSDANEASNANEGSDTAAALFDSQHEREEKAPRDVSQDVDADAVEKTERMRRKAEPHEAMLRAMAELSAKIRAKRFARGAVDFDFPEAQIHLGEDGRPISITRRERDIASLLIEDFMLAANEVVAEHFYRLETPFIYRVHEPPSPEKIEDLRNYVSYFGVSLKGREDGAGIAGLIRDIKGSPYEIPVAREALRSMMQARYSEESLGHFGLRAKYYCHFTAPIRRYPDLFVHRIIGDYLSRVAGFDAEAQVPANLINLDACARAAEQSGEREQNAESAERKVTAMKMAEYMEDHIGEVFDGTVTTVMSYGVFVQLDNLVEGLVHVTLMPDDEYEFDEQRLTLTGIRTREVFAVGDRVEVLVASSNSGTGKVDFSLVANLPFGRARRRGAPSGQPRRDARTDARADSRQDSRSAERIDARSKTKAPKKRGSSADRTGDRAKDRSKAKRKPARRAPSQKKGHGSGKHHKGRSM